MIKYNFKHLETSIVAFVADIEKKLQKILTELPVFILETGDMSYIIREKFIETTYDVVYEKIPRFVLRIQDFSRILENNSNPYNKFVYNFENENYQAVARRSNIVFNFDTDFVSSNFIMALQNFEIIDSIIQRENVFTYSYLGNNYEASYSLAGASNEKPGMDATASTRNYIVKTAIDLSIQIMSPRVESIKNVKDLDYDTVIFNINADEQNSKVIYTKNQQNE